MANNPQGISGVTVGNLISNSRSDLPIVYSQDIQGGLTSAADANARLQITAQRLQQGCIVYQESDDTYHRFLDTVVPNPGDPATPLLRGPAGTFTNAGAATGNITNETSWTEVAFNASEPAIIDDGGSVSLAPGLNARTNPYAYRQWSGSPSTGRSGHSCWHYLAYSSGSSGCCSASLVTG